MFTTSALAAARLAESLAEPATAKSRLMRMAMMEMTVSSSISVIP